MNEEILNKLHLHEKKILLALKELEKATPLEIAKKIQIPEASVHKAGLWAKIKGLISYEEEKVYEFSLTPEGEKILREGLPEKKLLNLVLKGKTEINELKKEFKDLDLVLAWARKKNWIIIEKNKLKITPQGENSLKTETEVEKALKEKKFEKKEILDELKRRKWIKIKEKKAKKFSLTPEGKNLLPLIKLEEEITQLDEYLIKSGEWKGKKFREYDVNLPVPKTHPAKPHPYVQFLNWVRKKLIVLGFKEMKGPLVETEFWNCDVLFMPQDHPARGIHDIFSLKHPEKGEVKEKDILKRVAETHKNGWITGSKGWGYWDIKKTLNLVMRSQTTAVSARTLAKGVNPPEEYFIIDVNFRPDVIDYKHLIEFRQVEGIVIGENLNLKHLLGYLEMFGKEIAGAEKIRFRPGFFPFTEPSIELDCYMNGKWIEIGGSGIFRPEVTRPLGIKETVLAWGLGIDRLAMIKLGIDDIRYLYSSNIDWLRKMPLVR